MTATRISFEEELISAEFMADPYPTLRQLRQCEPVYWSDAIGGWLLTRYDDIVTSFRNATIFSNEDRLTKTVDYLPAEKRADYKAIVEHYAVKGLIHSDPPDHTRLRGLVTQEFTPAVVEQMRPRIQEIVDQLLDAAEQKPEVDVVREFATPLPVGVIAEMLGVPFSDRLFMRKWTDDILSFQGVNKPSEADLARAQKGLQEIRPYLRSLIDERRRRPRRDLISKFVALESSGNKFSEPELINTCVTLIIAGHETTLSAISSTIYLLLAHPEQFDILKHTPNWLESASEETLRFESPVSRQARLMKADAELGGKKLRKGEIIFQMLNAGNRDPEHFTRPDEFDIRREKNRHLAFGLGVHFCAGATLARAEISIAVNSVLRRFPALRLVDNQPDWDVSKRTSRMLKSLRVRL